MPRHTRIALLAVGLLLVYGTLLPRLADSRLPGVDQGYAPEQPIRYSHRLHAGELSIPCLYCHSAAERGRHAAIPSADVCMNCHEYVLASWGAVQAEREDAEAEGRDSRRIVSEDLRPLYDALGLDAELVRDVSRSREPIRWVQVHHLPDFTYFDHRVHVAADVSCQTCHGPVETMERMRQHAPLTMGWCLDCHRQQNAKQPPDAPPVASTDCAACHY